MTIGKLLQALIKLENERPGLMDWNINEVNLFPMHSFLEPDYAEIQIAAESKTELKLLLNLCPDGEYEVKNSNVSG